jgi:3-oxoacyl-[acyl-carrier protein] reductase
VRLAGRTALVTGGGSGLGEAIALAFAREGADVAVIDLDPERAARTASRVETAGRRALSLPGDVSDPSGPEAWLREIARAWGRLDVLVNNAGYADAIPGVMERQMAQVVEGMQGEVKTSLDATISLSDEAWARMLAVHLSGTFHCTRAALRLMQPARRGAIVNMASVAGTTGLASVPHYSAAKAGIIGFTKAVAREVGPLGIRVNAIAPGFIDTPLLDVAGAQRPLFLSTVAAQTALRRVGEPREVAETAVFLASDDASYFVGQVLSPNGGLVV